MTVSTAVSAQGTIIQVGDGNSPLAFIIINNCSSIGGLRGGTRGDIDVTDLTSVAKEFRAGLRDNGSVTLAVNYQADELGHIRLEELLDEDDTETFKITDPEGNIFTFQGLVKKFDINWAVDSVEKSNVEIRISGAVVRT